MDMRPWEPEEDEIIRDAIERLGHKWSKIVELLDDRSVSAVRNRWQRMEKGRTGGISKNRCHQCGQMKRGHTCTARMGGGPSVALGRRTVRPRPSPSGLLSVDVHLAGMSEPFPSPPTMTRSDGSFSDLLTPTSRGLIAPSLFAPPAPTRVEHFAFPRMDSMGPPDVVEAPAVAPPARAPPALQLLASSELQAHQSKLLLEYASSPRADNSAAGQPPTPSSLAAQLFGSGGVATQLFAPVAPDAASHKDTPPSSLPEAFKENKEQFPPLHPQLAMMPPPVVQRKSSRILLGDFGDLIFD